MCRKHTALSIIFQYFWVHILGKDVCIFSVLQLPEKLHVLCDTISTSQRKRKPEIQRAIYHCPPWGLSRLSLSNLSSRRENSRQWRANWEPTSTRSLSTRVLCVEVKRNELCRSEFKADSMQLTFPKEMSPDWDHDTWSSRQIPQYFRLLCLLDSGMVYRTFQ